MDDCIFCKIIKKEIPSKVVYEDDFVLAFEDIAPQAPFHVVIIPKEHFASANDVTDNNSMYIAKIFEAIKTIANQNGIESYRVVNNCGADANQTVFHIHFHMIGGRKFTWPPG